MSTFGRFPTWANHLLRGKFTAVAALVELVCLMDNKTNRIRIGHERLAQRMDCSVSTAKRAINTLVSLGVIEREQTKYSANRYTVRMEVPVTDWDEWETLGEDDKEPKEVVVKGRVPRLVKFFSDEIELHNPMTIQPAVNGKALGRHFKEMLDTNEVTEYQLKTMIMLFAIDLDRGDRTVGDIPPWQMFLSDRQTLLNRVREGTEGIIYVDDMGLAE